MPSPRHPRAVPGMREGEAHALQSRCSQSLPLHMGWGQKNIETRPCAWQRVIRIAQDRHSSHHPRFFIHTFLAAHCLYQTPSN
jgi:hypothetical protein